MSNNFCKEETDIDCFLQENEDFGAGGHQDDHFPMNMLSDDTMTWAVDRERGMSFDLSALYDSEGPTDSAPDMKREVEIESESSFNDFPLGQSLSQSSRQAALPNPAIPTAHPLPSKRHLPQSFGSRSMSSVKRQLAELQSTTRDPPTSSRAQTRSQVARTSAPPGLTAVTSKTRTSASRGRGECGVPSSRRRCAADVDTVALAAQLGLVDGRNQCGRRGGKGGGVYRVGSYTLEERAEVVAKFHAKRGRRIWRKKIKYDCRKKLADKRPRLKGRFVTQEELNGLDPETLAKVTGLGPYEDSSSDVEAEDSDSSESYVAPTLSKVQNPSKTGKPGSCGGSTVHGDQTRAQTASSGRPSASPTRPGSRMKSIHSAYGTRGSRHLSLRSKGVSLVDDSSVEEVERNPGIIPGTLKQPTDDSGKGSSGSEVSVQALSVHTTGAPADAHCSSSSSRSRADSMGGFDVMEMFAPMEACGNGVSPLDSESQNCGPGEPDLKVEIEEDVKVDLYDHSDLVSGFMVEDILSNNFSVVSHHDIISPGVTVN